MNAVQFHLEEIRVSKKNLENVLNCLIHTILFNRAFGLTAPLETNIPKLDITYIKCKDLRTTLLVDSKIKEFKNNLTGLYNKGYVQILFHEKRKRKGFWKTFENLMCFEIWYIYIDIIDKNYDLHSDLTKRMMKIIQIINEKQNHLPRLKNNEMFPFPFKIIADHEKSTWFDVLNTLKPLSI